MTSIPDELLHGHLNQLVVRALKMDFNLFDVLQCACVNPVLHYGLSVGLLREGDSADFVINNPEEFWSHRHGLMENVLLKMDEQH